MANQRILRRVIVGVVGMAAAGFSAGCRSDGREPPPPAEGREQVLPMSGQNSTRRVTFGDLPGPVQDAFRRDHARADVTDAGRTVTASGAVLYRVAYRQDNLPAEATYQSDGTPFGAADVSAVSHPPGDPATRPGAVVR